MRLPPQAGGSDRPCSNGVSDLAAGRLQGSPYVAIRRIAVQYDQGVLFLRGRVTRFYEKQLAQEAVANLDGVVRVVNEIEVE